MNEQLAARIRRVWAAHFGINADRLIQPGTSVCFREKWDEDSWLLLWHFSDHTVVEIAPLWQYKISEIISYFPVGYQLKRDDLFGLWLDSDYSDGKNYALDTDIFKPVPTPEPYTARILTIEDKAAFDAFQAQSSVEERDEGEVGLDHELAVGIFDGDRIAAVASMYEWRGFSDIGVLVDPAYRRQGLGAAVTSYICETLLDQNHERIIVYRHDKVNIGSQGVAQRLNLPHFSDIDAIAPPSAT